MTNLRQAAEQALETLEEPHPGVRTSFTDAVKYREKIQKAITALRAALEQPEQEPVAWMYTRLKDGSSIKLVEKRAEMPEGGWSLYKEEPLYTTPPQRQWVGLTDEDFLEACQIAERGNYLLAFQRIQIKLKEKNS